MTPDKLRQARDTFDAREVTLRPPYVHPPLPPALAPMIAVVMQPQERLHPWHEQTYTLSVQITHMPGGWRGAHHWLCAALEKVAEELAKAEPAPLVKPYTAVPDPGNGLTG